MSRKTLNWILVVSVVFVILIWGTTFKITHQDIGPGELGDSFGMVNALFSALAFAFLIYTALLQSQELSLQRKEIEENRKQLEKTAEAQEELVRITEMAYRDKIYPYFVLEGYFLNTQNHFNFSLKLIGGAIKFHGLKSKESDKFQWAHPQETVGSIFSPNDIIESLFIPESVLLDSPALILYETLDDKKYCQPLVISGKRLVLGVPMEMTEGGIFFV